MVLIVILIRLQLLFDLLNFVDDVVDLRNFLLLLVAVCVAWDIVCVAWDAWEIIFVVCDVCTASSEPLTF